MLGVEDLVLDAPKEMDKGFAAKVEEISLGGSAEGISVDEYHLSIGLVGFVVVSFWGCMIHFRVPMTYIP